MSAFDRRSILLGGAGLGAGILALAGCPPSTTNEHETGGTPPKQGEGKNPEGEMTIGEVMPILVAVADRLIPADEHGPGVKDAGIETYLERTLADPRMKAIKSMLTRAAVFVGRAARKEHNKAYWELADAEKDDLIKRLADNQVRPSGFTPQAFVKVMLALSLEAFLGDPRHGGNKDGIGWKFVGGINWPGRQP